MGALAGLSGLWNARLDIELGRRSELPLTRLSIDGTPPLYLSQVLQ